MEKEAPIIEQAADPEHTAGEGDVAEADAELETTREPEPEAAAAEGPHAEPGPSSEPDTEPSPESSPGPSPEAEPAEEEPDQLSLDEMVEMLKADDGPGDELPPEGSDPEADAESAAPVEATLRPEEPAAPAPAQAPALEPGLARDRLAARLPFGILVGVWAVFVGVMAYLLWPEAVRPFVDTQTYAYFVLGGVALTLAGPLFGLIVWLFVRSGTDRDANAGLARAVFMRAAVATLAGDLLWWLGLVLLDLRRAGILG